MDDAFLSSKKDEPESARKHGSRNMREKYFSLLSRYYRDSKEHVDDRSIGAVLSQTKMGGRKKR